MEYDDSNTNALLTPQNPNEGKVVSKNLIYFLRFFLFYFHFCYTLLDTGDHRWTVRIDNCDKGHIFVGVVTSQASMDTYIGGDKFGW